MIKLPITTLSLFLVLAGCSQMQRQMNKAPNPEIADLIDTVDVEDAKSEAVKEYTHELAEADADDQAIKSEVGTTADVDAELPTNEVVSKGHFLKNKKTQRMQFWVDYFTKKQRDRFQRFINNGEEYRHHIEEVFAEHGLPKELYYVGLIESGYYLGAKSHASAVGPWQFIRGTGKRYGMKITNEYDERQDLFKATKAAAMYFRDLHNVFSSWELSLAAYNAGEYGIIRRIMKHGTRDFYEMSRRKLLPSETINYVPKVLAAMHVVENAEKYGFDIPKKKHRLFDRTELRPIKKNVSLNTIASRLKVPVALIKKLNPELRVGRTPRHFPGAYYLRIPEARYAYNLKSLEVQGASPAPVKVIAETILEKSSEKQASGPRARQKELNRRTASASPKFHKVRRGETLISVSRKYDISPKDLAEMNNFSSWKTRIKIGQRLSLQGEVSAKDLPSNVKVTHKPIMYKVQAGDHLTHLAELFKSSVKELKSANRLKRGRVLVGQNLVIPNTQKGIYTVRRGDYLIKVAEKLKMNPEALIKINALKRRTIIPGQKLIVNMD
ncbi:MAG: LysM peptidoglycan-binding domain-containing protein [Bacteriovoracaceae bacterium]